MKTWTQSKPTRFVLVLLAAVSWQSAHAGVCSDIFSSLPWARPSQGALSKYPEMKWREGITQANLNGEVARTGRLREMEIEAWKVDMEGDVLSSSTPTMNFFAEAGVPLRILVDTPGYGSGIASRYEVSRLGSGGVLRGTLLLPVSGHTGVANARKWAKTDTYTIYLSSNGKRISLVKDVKSLGIITVQELEMKLEKGKVYRLEYDRSGSAGPGGFFEGRVIEIVWDGT